MLYMSTGVREELIDSNHFCQLRNLMFRVSLKRLLEQTKIVVIFSKEERKTSSEQRYPKICLGSNQQSAAGYQMDLVGISRQIAYILCWRIAKIYRCWMPQPETDEGDVTSCTQPRAWVQEQILVGLTDKGSTFDVMRLELLKQFLPDLRLPLRIRFPANRIRMNQKVLLKSLVILAKTS